MPTTDEKVDIVAFNHEGGRCEGSFRLDTSVVGVRKTPVEKSRDEWLVRLRTCHRTTAEGVPGRLPVLRARLFEIGNQKIFAPAGLAKQQGQGDRNGDKFYFPSNSSWNVQYPALGWDAVW